MHTSIQSLVLLLLVAALPVWGAAPDQPAPTNAAAAAKPSMKTSDLFGSKVIAKGKGIEVTRGQLDDEALFYLQSRGIDRDAAGRMLVRAFAEQIIDRLNIPAVRRYVQHLIFDEWQAAPPIHPAP